MSKFLPYFVAALSLVVGIFSSGDEAIKYILIAIALNIQAVGLRLLDDKKKE